MAIHADDDHISGDVAPVIHLSTIYRYDNDPSKLKTAREIEGTDFDEIPFVYSRENQPNVARAEEVIGKITGGNAVLYSAGLSAFHAALTHLNPKKVFIGDGYHGCHGILSILERNYGTKVLTLADVESKVEAGDVVHVETPVNPYGLAIDLERYAKIAHAKGAKVICDATFAPPPILDPFALGADIVMHSASKYFGGHSDVLAGILVVKDQKTANALKDDRIFLGSICPTMESWLLLRSSRTFVSRVKQQFRSANEIVSYLSKNQEKLPKLKKIYHSSLQTEEFVKKQLPNGGPATFAIELDSGATARAFPSKLQYFTHSTSLGSVESLIEWRCMSDSGVADTLLRLSIGIEDTQDLIDDLVQALKQ